uniref:PiggyBac transposable element-derived protein domain-containing protein n=1 Tax=Oreochromis aureus TaxID=47969 RepID=A0A668SDX1_OREAU
MEKSFSQGQTCRQLDQTSGNLIHWKTTEDPDVVPQQPRFIPNRTPGVQPPLHCGNPSAGEIFSHFFDADVLKMLCTNTNKNAARNLQRGRRFEWEELTPVDIQKYLGLLLYMAILRLPKISDFWRTKTIFQTPFPASIMSRNQFYAISANIHMSDPDEDVENDKKKGSESYDCLHRIRPLLEMMRIRTMSLYHPSQNISVDERMVATKARLGIKQYMRDKPTKWGLKFFVLADVNGYTIDFKLYTGKSNVASGNGLSFDVVTSLINKDYLGSGYIIYCDNFYTGPLLFHHLGQQGFGACGTYRQGRAGVPSTQENALTEKSPRGSIRWIRDGDLLFVKWMDTREVSILSNIHTVYTGDTVLRWQKGEDGERRRVPVPRPAAVADYNRYMGGVDTSDQMLGTHSVHRKTRRWHITVFQHFLDIAVTNSYIIHKELCATQQQKHQSRQEFQEALCAHLLGVSLNPECPPAPSTNHFPVPTSSMEGQSKESMATQGRRKCTLCKRKTPWQCEQCGSLFPGG